MKKIIWYYPHLKFWMGGTKFLFEVTKHLGKKFKVIIICNVGDKNIIETFKRNKIEVATISFISTNNFFYWLFLPVFLLIDSALLFYHTYKNREINYIFSTLYPCNLICLFVSKILNKKYIYYCYEPFPFFHNKEFISQQRFPKNIILRVISLIYSWSDILATQRAFRLFTLNQITQEKIKLIYNKNAIITFMGVDTNHFKKKKNFELDKKFNNKIIITHSTDYTVMKRTELAILAIKELVEKHPNALLVITSTQPHSPEKKLYQMLVEKLKLEKNVLFLGFVSYNTLPLYYSRSVCYLSTSYDTMLGTTSSNLPVKEALACETPVIRAPITKEDVEDKVSGFLVNPKDSKKIAKKIEILIENPTIARQMGKVGRKKILALYNWDNVAKTIAKNLD